MKIDGKTSSGTEGSNNITNLFHAPDSCSSMKNSLKTSLSEIMNSLKLSDEAILVEGADENFINQMVQIKSYLNQYHSVYKLTQEEVIQLDARMNSDLSQISQFFDRIRRELDSKEQLIKMQYSSVIMSYQTSLNMDHDYLSDKCKSL